MPALSLADLTSQVALQPQGPAEPQHAPPTRAPPAVNTTEDHTPPAFTDATLKQARSLVVPLPSGQPPSVALSVFGVDDDCIPVPHSLGAGPTPTLTTPLDLPSSSHPSTPLAAPLAQTPTALTPSQLAKGKQRAVDLPVATQPANSSDSPKVNGLSKRSSTSTSTPTTRQEDKTAKPAPRARRTAALASNFGLSSVTSHSEKMEIQNLIRDCRDRMYEEAYERRYPALFLSNRALDSFNAVPYAGSLPFVHVGSVDTPTASSSTSTPLPTPSIPSCHQFTSSQPLLPSPSSTSVIDRPSFRLIDEAEEAILGGSRTRRRTDLQDMSDEYYTRLHRRYETFEKKLKIRERETMRHGRYKLKKRMDLIRSMDSRSFANLVGTPEEKDGEPGPSTAVSIHPEDIRDKMMEEAEELLKKYDLMLPNERARQAQNKRLEALEDSESDATPPPASQPSALSRPTSRLSLSTSAPYLAPTPAARPSSANVHRPTSTGHRTLAPAPSAAPDEPILQPASSLSIKIRLPVSLSTSSPGDASSSAGRKRLPPPASTDDVLMVDEHLLPQRGVGGRFLSGTTPRFKHKGSKSTSAFLAEATGGRKRSASPGGLEETQSSSKKKKKARRIEGGESAVGAEEGEPKTPLVYLPFKHVEYYIQPAERYSDMSVLVQEANRRIPEILARSEQAATGTVLPAHVRLPPPSVQAPPPGLIPPVPANVPNPTLPTSTMGPASTQLLPTANTLPSLPPSTDTNPFLPFHNALVPTSSKPLKRPTAKKKAPTGPTLAASRSTRHFLPWGVPPPRMLEFKSDFALDGEIWMLPLAEREARRAHEAEERSA